jgi:pyruvate dehydrogenase E1 component
VVEVDPVPPPEEEVFAEFREGSEGREVSTTMAFVRMLGKLLKDENVGPYLVPIIPDESRTFGVDALFRQAGIYSHAGQLYEPVDKKNVLYYKEARDGQILEEGITEAGSMASFVAAGAAYARHGVPTVPLYMFYSMFGIQRTGDQVWLAGDARARGFLMGCTAGRTTLNGEGLQHQDGHSHLWWSAIPNARNWDPAYGYEIATIFQDGLRRMLEENEAVLYYITLQNENYAQPPIPERKGVREEILKGMYRLKPCADPDAKRRAQLFGSGSILNAVLEAQELLADEFDVQADVWSVTSYREMRDDALACERWNMHHPGEDARTPYVTEALGDAPGAFVAATDFVKLLPDMVARWMPRPLISLGTDGYGRSDTRQALRRHFEVDAKAIALATMHGLYAEGSIRPKTVQKAIETLGIDPDKPDPLLA